MQRTTTSRRGLFSAIALGVLLGVLALLQYRWIGEVSAAESERLNTTASRAARLATRSFDERIGDLFFALTPDLTEQDTFNVDVLSDADLLPLIDTVLQIDLVKRPSSSQERPFVVRAWNEERSEFTPIPPDSRLRPLLRILRRDPPPVARGLDWLGEVEPSLPALIVGTGPRRVGTREPARRVYVIVLDRVGLQQLAETTLVAEIAQTLGSDIGVRILDQDGRRLFEQPELPADLDQDARLASQPILAIRPSAAMRRARVEGIVRRLELSGREEPPWLDRLRRNVTSEEEDWSGPGPDPFGPRGGVWVLELWNPSGDLESLVARNRRRNLLLGTAVLALLGLAAFQLWRSAQVERRTARRQLDFVAGITHELHTPLAAITSAGANLSDGVVSEPQRIRDYGLMIQREGQRLNSLVRQSLELAGLESSGADVARQRVPISDLLDRTRGATELICAETSVQLRVQATESVRHCTVEIDLDLMVRALGNLISNSVKHGASRVVLDARNERRWVILTVEDDGPGIPPEDRRFLFEPYRRGSNARGKGAGLGLYLALRIAESHGGSLRFLELTKSPAEAEAKGARFELRLPAVS